MWQLALLGPPRLMHDGRDVALTLKKGQALLLLLALGGPLGRPKAAAWLWPELDEPTARRNLRRELARLREAGAADIVRAQGDLLSLAPDVAVDLQAFESELRLSRPDEALRLWRGALADGLVLPEAPEFEEWLAHQRERVRALRAQALEVAAGLCERRGDLAGALARVHAQLDDDPLQEQRHRDAMRLLAALGRREAALAQYERCRDLLKQELGLAPMAQTEALAASMRQLSGTAAPADRVLPPGSAGGMRTLAAPAEGDAKVLPDQMPFVGRHDEAAALEAAWCEGRTLLIQGEAGVGKSRLAIDFVAAHGPHAVVRCRPTDRELPFTAFTRALRALAGATLTPETFPGAVSAELARLLPELGAPPRPLRSDAERAHFAEACVTAWTQLSLDNFDAVVLDDWHCADAASRELVARVIDRRHEQRAVAGIGAREVLVYRPEGELAELSDPSDLHGATALRRLVGDAPMHRLVLSTLSPAEVLELVQRLSWVSAPQRFVQRLLGTTSGNPFFLAETLRHWVERGLLAKDAAGRWCTPFDRDTSDYSELPVPGSVYATVLERVRRQSPACCRVLEAAAMATEPFVPALLAPACALSELDVVMAIGEAMQSQLLREHDSGGFAFAHDLVQQAIDSALSPDRRRLVHRRLALAAEAAGAAAGTIALHHEGSGDLPRAVPHRLRAGDDAQRLHALREAIEHWQRGLADRPSAAQALTLQLRLLQAFRALARMDDAQACVTRVLELSRRPELSVAEQVEAVTRAATHLSQARAPADALAELDALPLELPPPQEREVAVARASALHFLGRSADAVAVAGKALELPGLTGRQRAELLYHLASNENALGRAAAAAEHLALAISLHHGLHDADKRDLPRMTMLYGCTLFALERLDEAAVQLENAAALAGRVGDLRLERMSWFNLSCVRATQLQATASLDAAQRTRALLEREPDREFSAMLHSRFAEAHLMSGQLGAAWTDAGLAVRDVLAVAAPYTMMSVAMTVAELFAVVGEPAPLQPLVDTIDQLEASDPQLLAGMAQVSTEMWVARAQAALVRGERGAAAAALGRIGPDTAIEDPRVLQRSRIVRAELSLAEGDPAGALALLPPADATTAADGLRLRGWAVRVGAAHASGALSSDLVAAARAELVERPPVAVHAVAALHLHRALHQAAAGLAPALGAAVQADADEQVRRLAASLAGQSLLQARFLARWLAAGARVSSDVSH